MSCKFCDYYISNDDKDGRCYANKDAVGNAFPVERMEDETCFMDTTITYET